MVGMSNAALGQPRTAAEASAKREAVAQVAPENAAIPNGLSIKDGGVLPQERSSFKEEFAESTQAATTGFDQNAFVSGLGIKSGYGIGFFLGKTQEEGERLTGRHLKNMETLAEQQDAIRQHIIDAEVTPNELMDAIAAGDPSLKELTDLVKADPELAKAFHSAISKDPTMLAGLQNMVGANGTDGFNVDDLTELLQKDGFQGKMARTGLINGLNQVANTPLEFDHLLQLADNAKAMPEINSFADVLELMKNPDQMIATMLNGLDMPMDIKEMLAGFLSGLAPLLAQFIDPNGPIMGDFVQLGKDLGQTAQFAGRDVLNTTNGLTAQAAAEAQRLAGIPANAERTGAVPTTNASFRGAVEGLENDPTITTAEQLMEQANRVAENVASVSNAPAPAMT